jgi:hypothetical protein
MTVISNGTNLINNGAIDSGIATGAMTLIKTLTASSSATLSFVDGASSVVLDDTYDSYVFKFINIHPETDGAELEFQANAAGASGFNETITSTSFEANHKEDDNETGLSYITGGDQAQGTAFQGIQRNAYNTNDNGVCGTLHIYGISSTTFVKHFMSNMQSQQLDNVGMSINYFHAGYFNLTAAIDEFQFKFSSGNMDSGVIKLYGIGG